MQQLVGFSNKIQDPSFEKYRQQSNRWAIIFSVILALAAIIGFPVYGQSSGQLTLPNSLLYGFIIGAMFLIIAFFQVLKSNRDYTWDGEVINKRSYEKQHHDKDSSVVQYYTVYEYKVRRDDGKIITHRNQNNSAMYHYYQTGDRVRHHKGFYIYEKYDKSNDNHIYCVACGQINPIQMDQCKRCKKPLLT